MSAPRTPTTLLARWDKGNAQSAVPIIARTITSNLGGAGAGRRAVQIRPFRLPGKQLKEGPIGAGAAGAEQEGRNMYVLRSLSSSEQMMVFVEDLGAPSRAVKVQEAKNKGKEKEQEFDEIEGHSRWTFCTLGVATLAAPLATPFDAFLQRVLLGGNQQAINANNPGQWIPRSTAISLEGFIFHIGGDWEVKLGSVMVKGGSAGGSSKGVLIEATYLPVPNLPPSSSFLRNFMTTLFPPQAIANGEVEWVQPDFEGMYEAGINPRPAEGEQEGDWEWTEKHSAWTYLQLFKKASLL